jgi:hypothetical protein
MSFDVKWPDGVPTSEFCVDFVQGMVNRMCMSFFKYGRVADAFPHKVDAIATLKLWLDKYEADGNTEFLMDISNYAMIEFMRPRHPSAHFKPTDSKASSGRKWVGKVDPVHDPNIPRRID